MSTPGAQPDARRVVLFDFDGVLVHGDTFGLFIRARYAAAWWRKALLLLIIPWLLLKLLFGWRRALRSVVRLALLGLGEARYGELAHAFAARLVRRAHHFSRAGLTVLRQRVEAGDRVLVVTGCEDILVRAVLDGLGVRGVEVLASHLRHGVLGMRQDWHNIGQRKVEQLAQHGIDAWAVAYSDSALDLPMLSRAGEAVLVNATPRLCKRVEKALGHSVTRVEWD
ncbi:MAG TPA: haloacid dehalogenase-like hydrolase [Rhodanobacteraceae bacterium]